MDSIISLQLEAQKTSKLNKRLWKTPNFKEILKNMHNFTVERLMIECS